MDQTSPTKGIGSFAAGTTATQAYDRKNFLQVENVLYNKSILSAAAANNGAAHREVVRQYLKRNYNVEQDRIVF